MARYEFRSRIVQTQADNWGQPDNVEKICNEWAEQGFIVFSVVVPQGSNYLTYRLTAKRDKEEAFTHTMKFEKEP